MGIKRNRAKCRNCGDVIESTYRHEFMTCKCFSDREDNKGIFVDGGKDYLRRGGCLENIIELST